MRRILVLIQFEIRKILSQKKAFLFMMALNVVPLLASIFALLVYIKLKSLGLEAFQYSLLLKAVRGLFTAHVMFFSWISPFFLALIVGDSFSGEASRGYLKTLLLTPVERWQVITAKSLSILVFILLAISIGGFFLQIDLWVARAMMESPNMIGDLPEISTKLIDFKSALQILFISLIVNLTLVGFFILFSLFFDSPLLMTFVSLIFLLAMQTYVLMAPYLEKIDERYGKAVKWCFTRNLSELTKIETVMGLLEKKLNLASSEILPFLYGSIGWMVFFFLISFIIFQRKQILN